MLPLYLALGRNPRVQNATFRSQRISLGRYLYIFTSESSILALGYLRVAVLTIVGQAGQTSPVPTEKKNWSKTCRTVSKLCWPLVWLRLSQPVQIQHPSKSMSWLIPHQSQKSQCTPANTNNSALTGRRAAMWPAIHRSLQPWEGAAC